MVPQPTTEDGAAGLAAIVAQPQDSLVALDFDGTLAPIVTRPEDARPVDGALPAVRALTDRIGTCALITGRPAASVVDLAGLQPDDRVVVLGHYGLQRWQAGKLQTPAPDPGVDQVRHALPQLLDAAPAGVTVEDKEHSLVVHVRQTSDPPAALAAMERPLRQLAQEAGLEVVAGRYVWELRPPGVDKGAALTGLVNDVSAQAVVYVGDDVGDLPAFEAIDALRHRGLAGLCVASYSADDVDAPAALREHADLILAGPRAVVMFLRELTAALAAS